MQERGINFLDNVDIDEELRYSAVVRDNWRGREVQTDSWTSRESQTDSWRRPTETQSDSWRSHHETQNESGEALGSAIIDTPLDLSTSSSVVTGNAILLFVMLHGVFEKNMKISSNLLQDVDYTDFGSMLTSDSVENKSVTIDENARLVCLILF